MFVHNTVILCPPLLCSGAEQASEIYCHVREQTQKHLDSYAREGLRTLCIAKKVKMFIPWKTHFHHIKANPPIPLHLLLSALSDPITVHQSTPGSAVVRSHIHALLIFVIDCL